LSYGRETSHHSAARRLRIGCPLGEREPQRLRELLLGELPRAHRRNFCQDGREQMRAPGAVFHARAWRIDALAAQHVLHPVLVGTHAPELRPLVDSRPDRMVTSWAMVMPRVNESGSLASSGRCAAASCLVCSKYRLPHAIPTSALMTLFDADLMFACCEARGQPPPASGALAPPTRETESVGLQCPLFGRGCSRCHDYPRLLSSC